MRDRLDAALSDRYDIERELGRGGMATVWLARDRRHDRAVALKVLHPDLAGAIGVDRFIREVRLTARLQHPAIVPLLDSGVIPPTGDVALPWYTMPFVAGESLRSRLRREVHLPVEEALRITREVAGALQVAHKQGIVHRDIKPENILLADGRVYIVDFGIAKAVADTGDRGLTSTGLSLGTPAYMSPEQATSGIVDARSDQYSLAAVLYEMLAGEPPFTGPNAQTIIARRLAEPARPLRTVRPTVSESVEAVVLKALERVPADRFDDASAFAAALDTACRSAATQSPRADPRRRIERIVAVIALLLAVSAGAWALFGRRSDSLLLTLYQQGTRAYTRRTPEGAAEAIAKFSEAIRRDSSYARAWVGLAKVYVQAYGRRFVFPGVVRDSVLRLAVTAVDRALELDDTDSEAWTARAAVSRQVDPTDVSPAIRAARKAIGLDSADGQAWHFLAQSVAEQGDLRSAVAYWRESVRRRPAYTEGLAFLALGHMWRGSYDSAMVWADSAVAVDPAFLLGRSTMTQIAVERGEYTRGIAASDAARRLSTDVEIANSLAGRALAEARGGRKAEARATLRESEMEAEKYAPMPLHNAVYIAQAYAALGDRAAAVSWLRRYQNTQDLHFQLHLRCDPALAPLAGDPRFRALLLRAPSAGAC